MDATVSAAREKLKNVTPLKKDCGRVCGARSGVWAGFSIVFMGARSLMPRSFPGWPRGSPPRGRWFRPRSRAALPSAG